MGTRYPAIPATQFRAFVRIVRRLRRDCPWDRKQTHRSLRHALIEETYEVVEALDTRDISGLRHELGDLLLHIVLQATIAEQAGEFTLEDVIEDIARKLVRRHPHVFGTVRVKNAGEVKSNWERLKMQEGRASVLEGVPASMPALLRALRVQQRAARVGFDWKRKAEVWKKVQEEIEEARVAFSTRDYTRREAEFGDLLFALVNYSRFLHVNPEHALRTSIDKFSRRFMHIERELHRRGKTVHDASLAEMDALWNDAKGKRLPRLAGSRGRRKR